MATGDKFGEFPAVGIKLKVSHNETEIFESKYEQLTWFENVPNHNHTRVTNNSATAGYQSPPSPSPFSPFPLPHPPPTPHPHTNTLFRPPPPHNNLLTL